MIQYRSLRQEELESWFDHCVYVFNKGVPSEDYRNYFKNHYYNDPWRNLDDIFVAVEDGVILSTVRLFQRRMYLFGQFVDMGGIGEVSTKPDHQGKGLSTNLLKMAIRRMEEKRWPISALGSGKHDFYSKLGWRQMDRYRVVAPLQPQPQPQQNPDPAARPVDWSKDISALMRLYDQTSSSLNGPIVRDTQAYWDLWVRQEAKTFLVLENLNNTDELDAYISFEANEEMLYIREFAASPETDASRAWTALLAEIHNRLEKLPAKARLSREVAAKLGAAIQTEQTETDPYMMLRLNSPITININQMNDLTDHQHTATAQQITSTEQLIQRLSADGFTFWDLDSF